mgnify:CR=1 FL=1
MNDNTINNKESLPNIVFIMADDLGWMDTSLYGSKYYETPNIDSLAKNGMMFTNAYAASPWCSPTRASIMTGLYPARIGITAPQCHLDREQFKASLEKKADLEQKLLKCKSATRLSHEYYSLAKALQNAGYTTGHFGKWHLGPMPYDALNHRFDVDKPNTLAPSPKMAGYFAPWAVWSEYDKEGEHLEERMVKEAIEFMRKNKDTPFFLNYWCFSVHTPIEAKRELIKKYKDKRDPNNPQRHPYYAGMVETMDDAVGNLVEEIKRLGLFQNTIIIFYSDNGGLDKKTPQWGGKFSDEPVTSNHPLRRGKASIYEGGTRVPLVVVWPGVVEAKSISDEIVTSVDFYPTILDILGLESKKDQIFDGISLLPVLKGETVEREAIFCHFPHGEHAVYVRKNEWKLIRFFYDGENFKHRYELYNLEEDIAESNNLADKKPDKVKQLDLLIEDFLKDTGAVIPKLNPDYKK